MKAVRTTSLVMFLWALNAHLAAAEQVHVVTASTFANPADIRAYRRCIKSGNTAAYCRNKGDNGIGYWGDDTTLDRPMCALPHDVWLAKWKADAAAKGKKLKVSLGNKAMVCELRDTMPYTSHIKNGAGIDLNPRACRLLGLTPGNLWPNVHWRWAE